MICRKNFCRYNARSCDASPDALNMNNTPTTASAPVASSKGQS